MRTLVAACLITLSACAASTDVAERKALANHDDWPTIKALVKNEVVRREGPRGWTGSAAYSPVSLREDTWSVVAAADYPLNTLGRIIDVQLRLDGTIVSYERRWEHRK